MCAEGKDSMECTNAGLSDDQANEGSMPFTLSQQKHVPDGVKLGDFEKTDKDASIHVITEGKDSLESAAGACDAQTNEGKVVKNLSTDFNIAANKESCSLNTYQEKHVFDNCSSTNLSSDSVEVYKENADKDALVPVITQGMDPLEGVAQGSDEQAIEKKFAKNLLTDFNVAASMMIDKFDDFDPGESKERFRQRLWCYLFENLNRALDELYFLCELECDMEQIDEAVLVLKEAGLDFTELKSRVECFEKIKKAPSLTGSMAAGSTTDSCPTKMEHRRPHAISWEVRRMTSSPHRAEILSSSLEAFKKVQQETVQLKTAHQGKRRDAVKLLDIEQACKEELSCKSFQSKDPRPITKDIVAKSNTKQVSAMNCTDSSVQIPLLTNSKQIADLKVKKDASPGVIIATPSSSALNVPKKTLSGTKGSLSQNSEVLRSSSGDKAIGLVGHDLSREPMQQSMKSSSLSNQIDINNKGFESGKVCGSSTDEDKEKRLLKPRTSLDAWKEKRNWEDILTSPIRGLSRASRSPIVGRKSAEKVKVLHERLMSPERKKKSPLETKKEVDEKQARATRIRTELEIERAQRLQRASQKLNRVSEWQAVRSNKLREGMHARHRRGESRHEAYLAQIARRASDESSKVSEVRFITSLNEENKKLSLQQRLQDSELRRAERLQTIKIKQKEDVAREEAVIERRRLLEAERLHRIAEAQRRKEEAKARREEERRAASAAREAKAVEQVRKKEVRAKAQQEEAELLAQRLTEKLRESEVRRKVYLEQIRERAATELRDQSSPSTRRPPSKDGQLRTVNGGQSVDSEILKDQTVSGFSATKSQNSILRCQALKRKIKKIRQRLVARKYEFAEPPIGNEGTGVGPVSIMASAKSKVGRWLQELQRLQQARKAGASGIGLIIGEMVKYLEGKEAELHAARQAGLLDFVAAALPASHTSKPEASQTTLSFLYLQKVLLSLPANRSYFIARNLLPPLIPMLATALENFSSLGSSSITTGSNMGIDNNFVEKSSVDGKLEAIGEVLEGLLWCVTLIMGHVCTDERQLLMEKDLVELLVACEVIHRLRDLFSLFDRPQIEGAPFPSPVLLGLDLLQTLTNQRGKVSAIQNAHVNSMQLLDPGKSYEPVTKPGTVDRLSSIPENVEIKELKLSGTNEPVKSDEDGTLPREKDRTMFDDACSNQTKNSQSESNFIDTQTVDSDLRIHNQKSSTSEDDPNVTRVLNCNTANNEKTENDTIVPEKIRKEEGGLIENKIMEEHLKADQSFSERSSTDNNLVQDLNTRDVMKDEKASTQQETCIIIKTLGFLLRAIAETGLVGLPSLLTAVLLQTNPRSTMEQIASILPSNFEEVATGVLKVLNNLARLNLKMVQNMLAMPDLQMEFFHLVSFLLSYCTCKWKCTNDQVALLLLETLLLLGYFSLLHPGNQAVLRWGKSPTILHKICDLPFAFFSDPQLTPILVGTLLAACYGSERNRDVVQQELSMDMFLSLLKSAKDNNMSIEQSKDAQEAMDCSAISSLGTELDSILGDLDGEIHQVQERDEASCLQPQGGIKTESGDILNSESEMLSGSIQRLPNNRSGPTRVLPLDSVPASNKKSTKGTSRSLSYEGEASSKDLGSGKSNFKLTNGKGSMSTTGTENSTSQLKRVKGNATIMECSSKTTVSSVNTTSKRAPSRLQDQVSNVAHEMHSLDLPDCKDKNKTGVFPVFMLQNRFPVSLLDSAHGFFSAGLMSHV